MLGVLGARDPNARSTNPRARRARHLGALATLAGCAGLVAVLAGPAGATPSPNASCVVRDVTPGHLAKYTYPSSPGPLKAALVSVHTIAGDTLSIHGTCVGSFAVSKSLHLDGVGYPTLNGAKTATTLRVDALAAVSVSGLTITGGDDVSIGGGGINNFGTVSMTGLIIKGNVGTYGGGIRNHGSLSLRNSTVTNNTVGTWGAGGGIYDDPGGTMTLTNDTVSGNSAGDGSGGGVYDAGALTLTDTSLNGNSALYTGGGIVVCSATLALTNDTVNKNTANDGGGVYDGCSGGTGSQTTVNHTSVDGNKAGNAGGGIFNDSLSTLSATNFSVKGNTAVQGGGIFSDDPASGALVIDGSPVNASTNADVPGELVGNTTTTLFSPFQIFIS